MTGHASSVMRSGNMRTPRWMIERKYKNNSRDILQIIEVYAEGENKELVKTENRKWTHKRRLLLIESAK